MQRMAALLTTRELARRLRMAPEEVRAWARPGVILALRMFPKVIRYNGEARLATLATGPAKGVARAK